MQKCKLWCVRARLAALLQGTGPKTSCLLSLQITPGATMRDLFLPSLVSMLVPLMLMTWKAPELQGQVNSSSSAGSSSSCMISGAESMTSSSSEGNGGTSMLQPQTEAGGDATTAASLALTGAAAVALSEVGEEGLLFRPTSNRGSLVLLTGVGALVTVPLFKYVTGLPPYMGMLSGLAVLWLLTDALHFGEDKQYPRVQDALRNIDIVGVMFFFGILMAVEALNTAGLLQDLAQTLNEAVPNVDIIAGAIGIASALIDNVPLVAATMGMYDIAQVPTDSQLWQLVALCAGTGGSLLVIGSAAGVAYMGMEGAGFGWYAKHISPWVLAGYCASLAVYVASHGLPGSGLS